jgi:amino acid adenylation domain-containing protein
MTVSGGISMDVPAADGREFWLSVLAAGGRTTVPRWTLDPVSGIESVETTVPAGQAAALRRLASEIEIPLSSVVLAAHARVLAALSGERVVATGYVTKDRGQALPCVVTTEPSSWRALLAEAGRAEATLQSHQNFAVDDLKRETGLSGPVFETVFDSTGAEAQAASELPESTVLSVAPGLDGPELVLRLRYRTDAIDAACAARIAGYHRTALELMLAEPEAEHRRRCLLSADELRHQLDELSGPHRELPDLRVHELFEQQARANPDATAAIHGDRRLTYGQLNQRANQVARALQARGLGPEGVVAVVMERNLDWMTAVLAIFKAGGAYLPIEPHFPAERIATTLSRADCRLVLTESASTTTLTQATESLAAVQTMLVESVWDEGFATDDLGVEVGPGQLAYIYFTSGSTGEPKGAMCEHGGMLNHMYAKIDDLEIDQSSVVAQTAPQCFDISLWQLLSAVLVGGQTLIVEQDVVLDVQRFTDKIVDSAATVLQIVPSYLEAVLSYLERSPQKLADLRYVSVTGEAIKTELAQRWFAAQPDIKLVNAYGLTETSDDTNHEVMVEAPTGPVPLGRPVNNVRVYIVDEYLSPVPLGAPGAIVFSGICVGRGYINDPERTRLAFMDDPHRADTRLYRGGDDGRWRPDGAVDFLGRTDHQVKLHGFRIEIGEIESTLMRVPDVRDCAVIVAERGGQNAHLVAFYSSPAAITAESLSGTLGASLPEYMVPSFFHWQESLPLTANGKIDRKTLRALAADLHAAEDDYQVPKTPTERRLAAVWSEVLGIPEQQIGRRDNFFERGGTSLSAMKLAVSLNRQVSFKDLTQHPILADLAGVVDGRIDHRTGLLQCLSAPAGPSAGALVCFPYAGGNAVNFHPMAKALASSGLAVFAVEFPGHDVGHDGEPFEPLDQVVEQVVTEIAERDLGPVLLWGHSSGAAFAVETARRLQQNGVEVRRVFVAGHLLGNTAERRADIVELESYGNPEIAAALIADGGYTEIGDLDDEQAEHIGAAYRHDCVSAHRYFLDLLDSPPTLSAPVTVVLATDDPYTAEFTDRHRDWQLLAPRLDTYEIPDGGHYFVRTRPTEAAWAVLSSEQLSGARQ